MATAETEAAAALSTHSHIVRCFGLLDLWQQQLGHSSFSACLCPEVKLILIPGPSLLSQLQASF